MACVRSSIQSFPIFNSASCPRWSGDNPEKVCGNDTALHGLLLSGEGRCVGALLEAAVFLHLRRRRLSVSYLHTRVGHEIDFVATGGAAGRTQLIQVRGSVGS